MRGMLCMRNVVYGELSSEGLKLEQSGKSKR